MSESSCPGTSALSTVPAPGQLQVQHTTVGEQYDNHIKENGYFIAPPADADEATREEHRKADFRRWFSLRMARFSGSNRKYIEKLEEADTIAKLAVAVQRNQNVLSINDMVKKQGIDGFVQTIESAEQSTRAEAEKRLELAKSMDMLSGKAIPRGLISEEKLKDLGKHYNVYLRVEETAINEADERYLRLRANAEQARAFMQLGMQRPEYKDGIDESTSVAVRAKFEEDALAAASAMVAFENYQNLRTRDDGAWARHTRTDLKLFSDRMERESQGRLQRIDGVTLLDPVRLESIRREQQESVLATLLATEVFDLPVFTPRLASLVSQKPFPRTMPFTELFALYTSVLNVLVHSDMAPSAKDLAQANKERDKKLRKAGAKKLRSKRPLNRESYSASQCHHMFLEMRAHTRSVVAARLSKALQWYAELDREAENAAFWREQDGERPEHDPGAETRWEEIFYQEVYSAIEDYTVDILNAYEGGIILYLQDYVLKKEREYLSTPPELPKSSHMHPELPSKMRGTNAFLLEERAKMLGAKKKPESLPPVDKIADKKVMPHKPWSPTYAQLAQFMQFFGAMQTPGKKSLAASVRKFEEALRAKDAREAARQKKLAQEDKSSVPGTKVNAPV